MVKGTTGAVIDATLIESAAGPKKIITITLEVDAEGKTVQFEDGSQPEITYIEEQSADATWLKKGKKSHFGYRSYMVVLRARGAYRSCQPERNGTFRNNHRWRAHRGESSVCG